MKAHRGSTVINYIFSLTSALDGGGESTPLPGRFTPKTETQYQFYGRLDWPNSRHRRERTISSPLGFDPKTVQSVVSRYTD